IACFACVPCISDPGIYFPVGFPVSLEKECEALDYFSNSWGKPARARLWFVTSSLSGHAQRWCCTQKSMISGSWARTVLHAVHSMYSKRLREGGACVTTEACPKFCGVISCQQRLQTGGLACNRMPSVGAAGWYAISPTRLIGIVVSKWWRHGLQSWQRAGAGAASVYVLRRRV